MAVLLPCFSADGGLLVQALGTLGLVEAWVFIVYVNGAYQDFTYFEGVSLEQSQGTAPNSNDVVRKTKDHMVWPWGHRGSIEFGVDEHTLLVVLPFFVARWSERTVA